MTSAEAKQHVSDILDEERLNLTARYYYEPEPESKLFEREREAKPRKTHEDTFNYKFKGVNYQLLLALFSRFDESDRKQLIVTALMRIHDSGACRKLTWGEQWKHYMKWNEFVSELPLIAEFAVRVGETEQLLGFMNESKPTTNIVLLLMQIDDLIAFNWNELTRDQLNKVPASLFGLKKMADAAAGKSWDISTSDEREVGREISRLCDSIFEGCRKAKYLHLKAELLQMSNLEVNQDKVAVESHLKQLGFGDNLVKSLNHAEELYRSSSPFELKSSLGHLRSFLEALHCDAAAKVQSAAPAPSGWGNTVLFLRQQGLLTLSEEKCVTGLYTLISDQAVHPLIAEKEYARLARNMVIEYGLLFLGKLKSRKQPTP